MYIDILILSQILRGPKHGYEIKRNIERNLGNNIAVNNNMLYPALKHFEDQGIIRKEIVSQKGKPSRTVYSACAKAEKCLKSLIVDFPKDLAGHPKEFFVRSIFLSVLRPVERRTILKTRKFFIESELRRIEPVLKNPPAHRDHFFLSFMEFVRQRYKLEIRWISKMESFK